MSYHGHTNSSLPTPPHSPPPIDHMSTAIHLLDSLQAFYHRERTWVLHTRAEIEEKLIEGPDARTISDPASITSEPSSAYSSAESYGSNESTPPQVTSVDVVKAEPFDAQLPTDEQRRRNSRWTKRKNGFKLKLNGIGPKSRRRFVKAERDRGMSEPGAQLLEMFGDLVDARMESCQRITRLIRSANRADLLMH
ncbi:hypothetical protein OE88DRAFT_1652430 [Heliocybe sulcata]|uniref:Uncharacterized protein n=1 Tax=Heliocybe sulcata TaxID=5364 RepID=A0A5C3NG57_9AGAM|nr:hypothetical protein OE88DRAFT_1652430 [Heliocybe sulcata]